MCLNEHQNELFLGCAVFFFPLKPLLLTIFDKAASISSALVALCSKIEHCYIRVYVCAHNKKVKKKNEEQKKNKRIIIKI